MNFTPETIKQIFETTVFTGTAIRQIFEQIPELSLQDFVREYGDQIEGWIMPAKVTFPRKTKPLPEIVSRFVSQDDSRKALQGVIHYYGNLRIIVATDGKQLTYIPMPEDENPSEANKDGIPAVFIDGVENLDLIAPAHEQIENIALPSHFRNPVTIGNLDIMAGYIKARKNLNQIKKGLLSREDYFRVKLFDMDFNSDFILNFFTAFIDAGDREIEVACSGKPEDLNPIRLSGKSGLNIIVMPMRNIDYSKPNHPNMPASGFDLLAYAEKYQSGTYWKDYRKITAYGLEITGIDGEHGNPFLQPEQTGKIDVTADYSQIKDAYQKFSFLGGTMLFRAIGEKDFDEETEKTFAKLKIRLGIATDRTAELFRKFNRIIARLKSREDCIANMPEMWFVIAEYNDIVSRLNDTYKSQGRDISLPGFEKVSNEIIRNKIVSAVQTGKISMEQAEKIAPPGMNLNSESETTDNSGSPEISPETPVNAVKADNHGNKPEQWTIAPETCRKRIAGRHTRGRISGIIRRTGTARKYRRWQRTMANTAYMTYTTYTTYMETAMRTCLPAYVCGHGETCGPPGGWIKHPPGSDPPQNMTAAGNPDGRGPPCTDANAETCLPCGVKNFET